MRRIIIIALGLLMLLESLAFAGADFPTDRESIMLTGSAYFASQGGNDSNDDHRLTTIQITTGCNYFLVTNFAIGANLNLKRQSYGGESSTLFGIGPKISYFIGGESSRILPFFGGGVTFSSASGSCHGTAFYFGGGAAYMLNRHVAITTEVGFQIESYDYDTWYGDYSDNSNTFLIQVGIAPFLF